MTSLWDRASFFRSLAFLSGPSVSLSVTTPPLSAPWCFVTHQSSPSNYIEPYLSD